MSWDKCVKCNDVHSLDSLNTVYVSDTGEEVFMCDECFNICGGNWLSRDIRVRYCGYHRRYEIFQPYNEIHNLDGNGAICDSAIKEEPSRFIQCYHCEIRIDTEEARQGDDDEYLCDDCFDYYHRDRHDDDYQYEYIDEYHCSHCETKTFYRTPNEDTEVFFGIEHEISFGLYDKNLDNIAKQVKEIMNHDGHFIDIEEDCSIRYGGFECIYQPMTMNYIENYMEEKYERLFRLMHLHSADNCGCGIHIHVSRNAFKSRGQETALYTLMEVLKDDVIEFSGRTEDEVDEWCRFLVNDDEEITQVRVENRRGGSRYTVINSTRNTLEFRIFKGTTNIDTFKDYIKFTHSIVSIILSKQNWTDAELHDITFKEILNYKKTVDLL